jgi:hypothetical protein
MLLKSGRNQLKISTRNQSSHKISSSVGAWGRGRLDSAKNWARMFAIVRRFQKATAVAPRIAEPAMRNAVDQRPFLGAALSGPVPAKSSCLDSCVRAFPEIPISLSFSGCQRMIRHPVTVWHRTGQKVLSIFRINPKGDQHQQFGWVAVFEMGGFL